MTPENTRQLLAEIAAVDNRKLTPETARLWHTYLEQFEYTECKDALRIIRLNNPEIWITPGHLVSIIRRKLTDRGNANLASCSHRIPIGDYCHDCQHNPDTCHMCQPQPGISDTPENIRATIARFRQHTR